METMLNIILTVLILFFIGVFVREVRKNRAGPRGSCYDCVHCRMDKFYRCFCHYHLKGAFIGDGRSVDASGWCQYHRQKLL